jgi:hypothetical protein
VKFNLLFPDGRKLSGEVTLPGNPPISPPARRLIADQLEAGIKQLDARLRGRERRELATSARRLLNAVIPSIAAGLEPHLPPAAPAVRRVQTIEDPGRGTSTTSTTSRPAMPPPAIHAQHIAERLAPYVVAEQLVGQAAKAQAIQAAAAPVAAAVARHPTGRVAQLEDKLARGRLKGAAQ